MTPIHEDLVAQVVSELQIEGTIVRSVVELLEEGATVPFIARYRQERSGGIGLTAIQEIEFRYRELVALRSRKRAIIKNLKKLDKLPPEMEARVEECDDKAALEDLYLPYKARKESIARVWLDKGLMAFAEQVLTFDPPADVDAIFAKAVEELESVTSIEEAREGVRDILAELFAEDAEVRGQARELARSSGKIVSKVVAGKENEASRFQNFYDFAEPAAEIPSHRLLAIRRGEKEGYLNMTLDFDRDKIIDIMRNRILLGGSDTQLSFIAEVIEFAADNLIKPSIAREVRGETKRRADMESICVFIDNLRDMLLASPVGQATVIGVDPGNRTGTRLAIVDGAGQFVDSAVLFVNETEEEKLDETRATLAGLLEKYEPRFIAVGNGSTSREAEKFLRSILSKIENGPELVMINEAGVSVFAASDLAKEELPNQDVAARAAVSMARRIQDPLAELSKIEPRLIGVGQYQHDVNQRLLRERLAIEASACVNLVGADLNRASAPFLARISGLNETLGEAIVEHRKQNGPFLSRARLTEVKGIGAKTFEQASGFLRVADGEIPLDNTQIHPESYHIVERIAQDLGKSLDEVMADPSCLDAIEQEKYFDEKAQGATIIHIVEQLKSPGLDPRQPYEPVKFREDISDVSDLVPGMELDGRVSNVTRFGAFVDVGVHHDGLVHISEISTRFVSDPAEVVHVGQVVKVRVLGVEVEEGRTRLSLSMKPAPRKPRPKGPPGGQGKGRRPKPQRPQKERMRTLEDLLNRFGDPRKPRIDE